MVLAAIAEMIPHSSIAKKIDGDDQRSYESLVQTWMKGLELVDDEQINNGILVLLNSGNKFEPGLPEFISMCRGSTKAYHKPYKPLPKPLGNKEIAAANIAKMRGILGRQ